MDAAVAVIGLPVLPDEQLAESYVDGASACFDELVRRYSGPIYAFILRMVGRPEDADDLTQDVFVQLLRSLPSARPELPLRPWVYVIARNKCLDHLKRKKALNFSARTAPAAPPDVGGRARARLQAIRGARRLTLLALADSLALLGLAVLAFL